MKKILATMLMFVGPMEAALAQHSSSSSTVVKGCARYMAKSPYATTEAVPSLVKKRFSITLLNESSIAALTEQGKKVPALALHAVPRVEERHLISPDVLSWVNYTCDVKIYATQEDLAAGLVTIENIVESTGKYRAIYDRDSIQDGKDKACANGIRKVISEMSCKD